jgi:hypothetical protein
MQNSLTIADISKGPESICGDVGLGTVDEAINVGRGSIKGPHVLDMMYYGSEDHWGQQGSHTEVWLSLVLVQLPEICTRLEDVLQNLGHFSYLVILDILPRRLLRKRL